MQHLANMYHVCERDFAGSRAWQLGNIAMRVCNALGPN